MTEDEKWEAHRKEMIDAFASYAERSLVGLVQTVSTAEDLITEELDHVMIFDDSRERVSIEVMRTMEATERLREVVIEELAGIRGDFRKRLNYE